MPDKHLTTELFEKLMRDEMSPEDARELVWHLLATCPGCAEAIDGVADDLCRIDASRDSVLDADGFSFDRIQQRLRASLIRLDLERQEAEEFLAGLSHLPVEHLCLMMRNSPRHHTSSLCEIALERSWQLGLEEPKAADQLVDVILGITEDLPSSVYGDQLLQDLQARAWAYRGNFLRILSEHREADDAFRRAESHLGCGTGDQLELARLLDLKSSLRCSQGRFDEAHELVRRCVAIYVASEERHLAGRAMMSQAKVFGDSGEIARALQSLQQALQMIESDREPRLTMIGQFQVMHHLVELGRHQEAMSLLPKVRRLVIEHGSRFDLLRLRLSEGNILEGLGHEARAEAAYLEVRKGFIELDVAFDAAYVSLELTALYLRQDRASEAKRLAAELIPIFQSRDVHQEALAALELFHRAVERETLSLRLVEEVSSRLRRARHDASPRFQIG